MTSPSPQSVAKEIFGFKQLRPGQRRAVQSVLKGRDTLAIMPTASGKSAIYQIAGVMVEGTTVVVSPLLALQRDQVAALRDIDAGGAAEANSLVPENDVKDTLENFEGGHLEFLFLAPEQLANPDILTRLRSSRPSLFVVDEAHCVSEWGHDFRPHYLRVGTVIEELGHPTVLALTATAAPPVREEMIQRLKMHDPLVVAQGFDRPNIHLEVRRAHDPAEKDKEIVRTAKELNGSGIVYTATRKISEELKDLLEQEGIQAAVYHAGLKASSRKEMQDRFMSDDIRVMVATSAFGMGIDKPDVRFILHANVEGSLDAYYQQIGRAGRDGKPARAILFYRSEDLGLRRFFASKKDEPLLLEKLATYVEEEGRTSTEALAPRIGLSKRRVVDLANQLAEVGALTVDSQGDIFWSGDRSPRDAVEACLHRQARRRSFDQSRIEMMRAYAETRDCRRRFLLAYFGEGLDQSCGNCDRCVATGGKGPQELEEYRAGKRVQHPEFGNGTIMASSMDTVVVLFDQVGYRSLDSRMVEEKKLLNGRAS